MWNQSFLCYNPYMSKKIEKNEKGVIKISVRDLVEFILREGDIDNRHGRGASAEAMLAEGRIHRKIQKRMGSDYHAEVPLPVSPHRSSASTQSAPSPADERYTEFWFPSGVRPYAPVLRILPLCQSWLFLCLYCLYCLNDCYCFKCTSILLYGISMPASSNDSLICSRMSHLVCQ